MLIFAHVNKFDTYVKKVGFDQLILGKKKHMQISYVTLDNTSCVDDLSVSFINIAEINIGNTTCV